MQLLFLIPLFLMGAAGSSLLAYLGQLSPLIAGIGKALFILVLLLIIGGFVLDDAIRPLCHLDHNQYYAALIAAGVALILGLGVIWLL